MAAWVDFCFLAPNEHCQDLIALGMLNVGNGSEVDAHKDFLFPPGIRVAL